MTAPTIEIRRATPEDRLPLFRMLELYQYELSDIWDQDLDVHGEYGYGLDRYWADARCHPFVARIEGHYAGFALVDAAVKVNDVGLWMDQFFVLKKYRRSGVGKAMAISVFTELPAQWEVGQMASNLAAQSFWRTVIGQYTGGNFTEHALAGDWWEGYVQCFSNAAQP